MAHQPGLMQVKAWPCLGRRMRTLQGGWAVFTGLFEATEVVTYIGV